MTMNSELEACYIDYNRRRQEALDHGEGRLMMEIGNLPVSKEIQLPSIAYWIALSPDELLVAVAYANSVALFKVAHIVKAVRYDLFTTVKFLTFINWSFPIVTWFLYFNICLFFDAGEPSALSHIRRAASTGNCLVLRP